ncbi:hypothetical protein PROFUN_15328 [Planoprotostelium fungivorum]|uniref:Uncharacterized protein n=1 Tax=Planoprotostelium fungivorum TaxID=1890364 RepID=A0A2P6MWX9_9EUKA|nr:hypothetical protein PROFUN_15328 [Planoprotostelium fungivorum]
MLKRQRTESYGRVSSTAEDTALSVLLSSEKAMVVVGFNNNTGCSIRLVNDSAQEILSQLWDNPGYSDDSTRSFWTSVMATAKGEKGRKDELDLFGQPLRIKYRRTEVKGELIVIASAKKMKSRDAIFPFELNGLINALEEDVIGKTLGMIEINVSLLKIPRRGRHTYLVGNRNVANIFHLQDAYLLRNKSCEELECLESDSALMYDQFKSYAHPETKTATFSMDLEKFPNTTFLTSSREVLPDIFLCLCIAHNRTSPRGPRLPSVPKAGIPKMWIRNRWDQFMEECIHFVNLNRHHSVSTRTKLPEGFLQDDDQVFCYAYVSNQPFLPSGNSDGYIWKSSRGVVCAGNLQRKYHYTELPNGMKLRRRVMWLEDVKDVWMIEYRHFENGTNTKADKLIGSEAMDWQSILREIYSQPNTQLGVEADNMTAHFQMAETRVDASELGTHNVETYVNSILHSWASAYGR